MNILTSFAVNRFAGICKILFIFVTFTALKASTDRAWSTYSPYAQWRWHEVGPLSKIQILSLSQSSRGNLYVGSERGLFSYDGYHLKALLVPEAAERVLSVVAVSDSEIHYLTNSYWGVIHDGSNKRLYSFDSPRVEISAFALSPSQTVYLGTSKGLLQGDDQGVRPVETVFQTIGSIACTRSGLVWLSNPQTGELAVYRPDPSARGEFHLIKLLTPSQKLARHPFKLFADSKENVWIVSQDPEIPPFYYTSTYSEVATTDLRKWGGSNTLMSITESQDGTIWLGGRRFLYRFENGEWAVLDSEKLDIPTNSPSLLFLRNGSLLVCGLRAKAMIFDSNKDRFGSYKGLHYQGTDEQGNRWFISVKNQVGYCTKDEKIWRWFGEKEGLPERVEEVFISKSGVVWVAGIHHKVPTISHYNDKTWVKDQFPDLGNRFESLSAYETAAGDIVFGNGTEQVSKTVNEGGLVRYSLSNGLYTPSRIRPPETPFRVNKILEGEAGTLYFSGSGLSCRTESKYQIIPVPDFFKNDLWIDSMAKGSGSDLWIAAWGKGVYRFDGSQHQWQVFSESDGLLSNRCIYCVSSRFGPGPWVGTQKGVIRFDGQKWTMVFPFNNPVSREGLKLVEGKDGTLWMNFAPRSWFFGNTIREGDWDHYCLRYTLEKNRPMVTFTDLPSKTVKGGDLYFQWSGTDFWSETPQEALEYSYRMDDGAWSVFSQSTQMKFSDLKPGKHFLEVQVRDRDWNVSDKPARYEFAYELPLTRQPWFILLVMGTVVVLIALVTIIIRSRIRYLLEIEDLKIQFFTYLSHELRTPLAVVLGSVESALDKVEDSSVLEKLKLARKGANRILSLVDQLLDFKKFEYSKKKFNPQPSDLKVFLRDSVESIRSLSEAKQQSLKLEINFQEGYCSFDPEMLQKICDNLIGNAIKYSPEGSSVGVRASLEKSDQDPSRMQLHLIVEDEGPGIPLGLQRFVFEPFYRVNRAGERIKGTGLGLALVKEIVEAWGGTITILSPLSENKGTRFSLVLPVQTAQRDLAQVDADQLSLQGSRELVLIVDDDDDFRQFIQMELSQKFNVICAKDGAEGWKLALENDPRVVVTDYHMPGMNGLVLCQTIKSRLETSHIPVILMTSDLAPETELSGFKGEADDVLHKPVSISLLLTRLESLIESRKRLRSLFSQQLKVEPSEITVTTVDEETLTKAIAVVESHIQEEDFDVEFFAKKMGMSSRTLHRKLSGITNMTPGEFIRSIRMKRAAQMFKAGLTQVSEVMFQVGILEPSHFSRCFKKEFGKSPTQYLKELEGSQK